MSEEQTEVLGPNFRLSTRKEFVQTLLIEHTGVDMNFSVPGPNKFRLLEDG